MPARFTRRSLVHGALAGVAAAQLDWAWLAPAAGAASIGWDDADYWAFCDRTQGLVEDLWSEGERAYRGGEGGDTSYNASMLFTHAAAARMGHQGACRNDHRARQLAWRLCQSPPYRLTLAVASLDQTHRFGWGSSLNSVGGQHVVIDTAVVRGLAEAWYARRALNLPDATVGLIEDRIRRNATSQFYLYPALRLNQINWPVEIYVHATRVTGASVLVQRDLRAQFDRFAHALRNPAPGMRIANLGPGYRWHYLPNRSADSPINVDSAEYANIVCGSLAFYDEALRMNMTPLPANHVQLLRAWAERVLCGYWTHGGYLNWDTGHGFGRWHQGKKHGLCQAALLAIALTPRFRFTAQQSAWAKYFFDRSLEFFDAVSHDGTLLPPPVSFGVTKTPGSVGDARLWASRVMAHSARAAESRLGTQHSEVPPPLYAFDPDIGRLAVTTPTYNTAIIVVNQRAFPYGGIELARLYDGDQHVAANIGGVGPAAFGVTVRDHARGTVTYSQHGRRHASLAQPPLLLTRAPRGAVAHPVAYPDRPYAGPFGVIDAVGHTTSAAYTIRSRHRFRGDYIEVRWDLLPRRRRGACTVEVAFPSWGAGATVVAHTASGADVPLGARAISLAGVRRLAIHSAAASYDVELRGSGHGLTARLVQTPPQPSNPRGGPTLLIRLDHRRPPHRQAFTVRLHVAPVRASRGRSGSPQRRVAAAG